MSFIGLEPHWRETQLYWERYEFPNVLPYRKFAQVSNMSSINGIYHMSIAQDIYNERRPFLMLDITGPAKDVEDAKRITDEIIRKRYGDIILSQKRIAKIELLV